MSHRFLESILTSSGALAVVIAVVSLAPIRVAAQTSSAAGKAKTTATARAWTQPRTPDGQPDLQGIWSNATTTPLERPAALAGKQVLTHEETTELQKQTAQNRNTDRRDGSFQGRRRR